MTTKRVLSVGQCGFDHGGIAQVFRQAFGAEVAAAATADETLEALRQGPVALMLVNRVLDADGASGLDLIRRIKADAALRTTPILLVSNYADAQQQAVAAGAAPGFGKSELGRPAMLERVRPFLGE